MNPNPKSIDAVLKQLITVRELGRDEPKEGLIWVEVNGKPFEIVDWVNFKAELKSLIMSSIIGELELEVRQLKNLSAPSKNMRAIYQNQLRRKQGQALDRLMKEER